MYTAKITLGNGAYGYLSLVLVSPLVKYKWGKEQQKAFDEMKQKVSKETLLAFPEFEKEFYVYTDASNKQLGAVTMQEGKPLAFYSRKLNSAQTRYTTGEQELLSIRSASYSTYWPFEYLVWQAVK
jgi:hypothetical protein